MAKRRTEREPKREFRWQLSERQWAYLGWLIDNTAIGRTEKDVAQYLLNQKIQEMRLGNYSEPQPEGTQPTGGVAKETPGE
jgi:hypothetical protein